MSCKVHEGAHHTSVTSSPRDVGYLLKGHSSSKAMQFSKLGKVDMSDGLWGTALMAVTTSAVSVCKRSLRMIAS